MSSIYDIFELHGVMTVMCDAVQDMLDTIGKVSAYSKLFEDVEAALLGGRRLVDRLNGEKEPQKVPFLFVENADGTRSISVGFGEGKVVYNNVTLESWLSTLGYCRAEDLEKISGGRMATFVVVERKWQNDRFWEERIEVETG